MAAQRLDLLRAQRDLYGAAFIRLLWYDHAARIHDSTVRTCTPMSCATPSSVYLPSGHCDRDPWRRSYLAEAISHRRRRYHTAPRVIGAPWTVV